MKNASGLGIFIVLALLLVYGYLLAHKIDLTTADLGRHIKNGENLLKHFDFEILKTNFYSYTEPDFPTTNHHWLFGAVFFVIWKLAGFAGVHFVFIAISLATFLIFFKIAEEKIGIGPASILALIAIPLLAERTEIRPEVFSYLFSGLFLWGLLKWNEEKISFKQLLLFLLTIQIIWVNSHIFFFLGFAIAGTFLFSRNLKKIALLIISLFAVSLINPFGIAGLLEPLSILREYGYSLAENKSVWFLENYGIWRPGFEIFKFAVLLTALSFAWVLIKKRQNLAILQNFFLAGGISAMAVLQSRNLALFGFVLMPVLAQNIENLKIDSLRKFSKEIKYAGAGLCFFTIFLLISTNISALFPYSGNFGVGLQENNSAPIKYFKKENLKGPIFNNYDIGGYLIFHLFPQEKVFVDNRPEAYSADFFKKIYIPAQENDEAWNKLNKQYKFNSIIFSHRDITPWGQNFLKARLEDKEWKQVFADERVIIFTPTP
ncbi:MAG: hypothetical protein AAB556_01195 [Patescibacteria group bacterium]